MRSLDGILIFTKVADLGSFTAAARVLRVPLATVSRRVAELESDLGLRLMNRTTRKLSLTDVGRRYHEHGRRIMEELEAAEAQVARAKHEPSGALRITAPVLFAQKRLAPVLADFLVAHPQVTCSLDATDRVVDLIGEGYDLAIRGGVIRDSSFIAKPMGKIVSALYAAPAMLTEVGGQVELSNLTEMPVVDVRVHGLGHRSWVLTSLHDVMPERREISIIPRIEANDAATVAELVMRGLGIGHLPTFVGDPLVARGDIVRVLPDWTAGETPVNAIYPSHRGLTPTVRALIDAFRERLADAK